MSITTPLFGKFSLFDYMQLKNKQNFSYGAPLFIFAQLPFAFPLSLVPLYYVSHAGYEDTN